MMTTTADKYPARFTLDDEPIDDLGEFVRDNDFDPETVNAIGRLAPGESMLLGGGAGAEFLLRRVA